MTKTIKVLTKVPIGYELDCAYYNRCPQSWLEYYREMPSNYDRALVEKAIKGEAKCPQSWLEYYRKMPKGYDPESAAKDECPPAWIECFCGDPWWDRGIECEDRYLEQIDSSQAFAGYVSTY